MAERKMEYKSVLVAFGEEDFDDQVVATARSLAAEKRGVHIVALVQVPKHLPLDAPLDARESEAQSKIERAKLICGARISGKVVRVRPGQAGTAIVDAARELNAAAIVMPLRYRAGSPVYSKTLETVLAKRPCRVIVSANPDAARSGIGTPAPG